MHKFVLKITIIYDKLKLNLTFGVDKALRGGLNPNFWQYNF